MPWDLYSAVLYAVSVRTNAAGVHVGRFCVAKPWYVVRVKSCCKNAWPFKSSNGDNAIAHAINDNGEKHDVSNLNLDCSKPPGIPMKTVTFHPPPR